LLAKYPVVLFCDDDAEPLPGLLQAHSAVYAQSGVAGVAGAVLSPSQVPLAEKALTDSRLERVADSPPIGKVRAWDMREYGNFGSRLPGDVDRGDVCNLSFRRDVLLDVNGFNSQFGNGPATYEDLELCLRIRKRGWRLAFEPSAAVVHEDTPWRGSLWSYGRWVYWRFKYRAAIFCRHLNLIGLPIFPFLEFLRLLALKNVFAPSAGRTAGLWGKNTRVGVVALACGLAGTLIGLLEGLPDILDRLLALLGLELGRCDYGDLDKVLAEYGLMMVA
jgi:GT2 family glycosyltransferase